MANPQREPERDRLPQLKLTADNLRELQGISKFTAAELQMIAELSPVALYSDFKRFIYRCAELNLNPLHNDAHLEYRFSHGKARALTVIHIDGYRKIADASGELDGFKQTRGQDDRGEFVDTLIYRKGRTHPFESRVYFDEFMQSGDYSLYKSKPYHMIAKCSAALCYKIAFPVSGMITEDEVAVWVDPGEHATQAENPAPADNPYTVAETEKAAPEEPEQGVLLQTPPGQQQKTAHKTDNEIYKETINAIIIMGADAALVKEYLARYFGSDKKGIKDPKRAIDAVTKALEFIKEYGADEFRRRVEDPNYKIYTSLKP